MSEKIDFVMLWVDPNDEKWQAKREKYAAREGLRQDSFVGGDEGGSLRNDVDGILGLRQGVDDREVRYRDWENLQYWFRSVEKYAGWVNKIHLVVDGHVPEWLDTSNPKINIVQHADFIPEEYLPTFNSNTISLNLHRLKSLSERFVYFNDDMFFVKETTAEDFFKDGQPRAAATMAAAIMNDKNDFDSVRLNNISIINTHFQKNEVIRKAIFKWMNPKYQVKYLVKSWLALPYKAFPGIQSYHTANSHMKKTFRKVWKEEFEVLDATCRRKFRNNKLDVNDWLMHDWQIVEGEFVPRRTSFSKYVDVEAGTDFAKVLGDRKAKIVCLNDTEKLGEKDFEWKKKELLKELARRFPERSEYERG